VSQDTPTTRRGFLQGAARYATAGVLVGGTGLLVLVPRDEAQADCTRSIACRGCRQFARCELPRARQAKIPQQPEASHGGHGHDPS